MSERLLAETRQQAHPDCVFCGPLAAAGLELHDDGEAGVCGSYACPATAMGYPGLVHGGVAAGLLDAAMTNALFARGVVALTARLSVRYHQPLRLGCQAQVRANAEARRGAWWIVHGEVHQDGVVAVSAVAWFRTAERS